MSIYTSISMYLCIYLSKIGLIHLDAIHRSRSVFPQLNVLNKGKLLLPNSSNQINPTLPDFVLMPFLNKPLCPDLKGDRNFYPCMILKWQAVTYINFLKFYQGFILVQLSLYCLIVTWCQAVSGWKCSVGEAASVFEDLFT